MVSASATTWSAVMSSSPRMTRTVSGKISSSRSTSFTRRLPATSTSRRGLRSITFTRLFPRKSRRRLDLAELLQMVQVMARLQAPPLAKIHLAQPEVLEGERARVARREPFDRLTTAGSRGLHGRDQLVDGLAVTGPYPRRRLGRAERSPWHRRELGEVGRKHRTRGRFLQELRRQLAGVDFGQGQVIKDLAHRPLALARLPVGLLLRQLLSSAEQLRA